MRYVSEKIATFHKRRKVRRAGAIRLKQTLAGKIAKGSYAEPQLRDRAETPVEADFVRLSDEQIARIEALCDEPPPVTEHLQQVLASPPWKFGS